jgi:hypothetical protein
MSDEEYLDVLSLACHVDDPDFEHDGTVNCVDYAGEL